MKIDLDRLTRKLNYQFENKAFLKQALTHCSMGSENYERFEFLGDSILSFIIAHELFNRFPDQSEGQLSRLRSFLVRGDMLAELALELGLGDYLYLGPGELKSGGFRRSSILSDALEAVFAAVFLDGGIDAAKAVILSLYQSRLNDPNLNDCLKDAKTRLQEYLQATKIALPEYLLVHSEGDEHEQMFYVKCIVSSLKLETLGEGSSRRKAEQMAARSMLSQLEKR
ncbi:MAG: ribonuclease III [Legionella sp. 40-6]|nr:ribonuclease III [Legionella sp.]OJY40898.1 MAG: ribonuclease III [Legionella sp. 40-6]